MCENVAHRSQRRQETLVRRSHSVSATAKSGPKFEIVPRGPSTAVNFHPGIPLHARQVEVIRVRIVTQDASRENIPRPIDRAPIL